MFDGATRIRLISLMEGNKMEGRTEKNMYPLLNYIISGIKNTLS